MALDFPNAPTNGQIYTDAGTGEQWVYEAATNSWTSKGLVNTTGGLQYKGDINITAAPPTGVTSGSQYSVNPGGTANAGFGPDVTGNVAKGSMVMYTGTGWVETSHAVPEATATVKGIDTRKWNRTGTVLSPATAGDVVNISAGTAALPGLTPVGDPDSGLFSAGANQIGIATNGTGRLFVAANGRVGIGTPNANATLDVRGKLYLNNGSASYFDAGSPGLTITNPTAIRLEINSSEAARINSSGRLLVGTSAATGNNLLQVNSDALINSLTVGRGAGNIKSNVAVGEQALSSNTSGTESTAVGRKALHSNTTGGLNTALGLNSLYANDVGGRNTALGVQALTANTSGSFNVAVGVNALKDNTTGSGNIGIGFNSDIGAYAPVFNPITESNRLVLGTTAITNAYVQVAWTVTSDARDKMNFAPVPYGLDFVNRLNPTAYQFKVDRDTETPNGDTRYGFKAQDILALEGDNPVIIDAEDPEHLKYKGEHLVPVLVNAIKELSAEVEKLKAQLQAL